MTSRGPSCRWVVGHRAVRRDPTGRSATLVGDRLGGGAGGLGVEVAAALLERLVLVSRGVDAKSLVVPEAGHLAQRAAYESNLRAYSDGGPRGVHAWALYGAEAFAAGAEASPLRG